MDIWESCHGADYIEPLAGTLWRLVESQEEIATLGYVDTLEEQALLEELLDQAKPPYPDGCAGLHYLLKTPFRYPPLKWGSRFGRRHEPGIFYGGGSVDAALAESAYYRYVFWFSMDAPPPKDKIISQHALFSVGFRTQQGVKLHAAPFQQYRALLTDRSDYGATQTLGTAMRAAGVQAFEYVSARDPKGNHCVGLFTPAALAQKRPKDINPWFCELSATEVSFKQANASAIWTFPLDTFLLAGKLPLPA